MSQLLQAIRGPFSHSSSDHLRNTIDSDLVAAVSHFSVKYFTVNGLVYGFIPIRRPIIV